MRYGLDENKTGYGVGKSLMFVVEINEIGDS